MSAVTSNRSSDTKPDYQARANAPGASESRFGLMNCKQFDQADCKLEWLVENVLVRDQPGVIGGPPKSLKTSLAIDLAISIGSGKPFLGQFKVPERCRVAVYSGESGQGAIREIAVRVCKSKGLEFDQSCRVYWSFNLPRLADPADLESFTTTLREKKISVVIVDPLYLCLHGGSRAISSTNLYDIGPVLQQFSNACIVGGATPIFVHHATKTSEKKDKDVPPSLRDLTFAGIIEFVRQWIQVKHRTEFHPGSGKHKLSLCVGGSAGHSNAWHLNIDEGRQRADFSGRIWDVQVNRFDENDKL